MLEKSFGLLFYLKKPKNYQKGGMPVYLRITVDDVPKESSTALDWEPSRWNVHAQRALGTKEDAKVLNIHLDTLQTKAYEAKRRLLEDNKTITSELLKNILKGKNGASENAPGNLSVPQRSIERTGRQRSIAGNTGTV